jgi:SNF2 family DNA or RNA helicase
MILIYNVNRKNLNYFMVRNYRFKTKPYEHQLVALEKSWDKDEYAYFMEMGLENQKFLLIILLCCMTRGKINAAMIIAPKGVYRNWLSSEIPTHLPSHIQYKSVLWTALTSKTKDKEYQSLFETDYNLHIFIMNVEALSTPKGLTFARKFLSCHNTLIAVDESTTIKTPKAARTKNIVGIASLAKYRRILTGSPVTKSPLDLYTQCKFLNEDLLGFASYYSFQNRFACMG